MKNFFANFGYAVKGILAGLRSERNLRVQVFIGTVAVGAGFYFQISSMEWCVILLCIGMVIVTELINTSIEKLVDLVTKERLPLAAKIKDMAAGAVLIISSTALIIGIIIFGKHLY